jgi:hypothetical protein
VGRKILDREFEEHLSSSGRGEEGPERERTCRREGAFASKWYQSIEKFFAFYSREKGRIHHAAKKKR